MESQELLFYRIFLFFSQILLQLIHQHFYVSPSVPHLLSYTDTLKASEEKKEPNRAQARYANERSEYFEVTYRLC